MKRITKIKKISKESKPMIGEEKRAKMIGREKSGLTSR